MTDGIVLGLKADIASNVPKMNDINCLSGFVHTVTVRPGGSEVIQPSPKASVMSDV